LIMSMLISASHSHSDKATTFLSLCMSNSDKTKLQDAAYIADTEPLNSSPPKVTIKLHCEKEVGLAVECHISKLLHGRRVIGMHTVGHDSKHKATLGADDAQSVLDGTSTSDDSNSPSEPLSVQMTLGLHNCCETLKLTPALRRMLTLLFQTPSMACAIFVWSEATAASIAPTLVVASRRLQSDWLPQHPMPQILTKLLVEDSVSRIISGLNGSESALHLWSGIATLGGSATTVAALPLNRLSRDGATADVQLCLLAIGQGITDTSPTERSYAQWQVVHGSLVPLGEATVTTMKPPHLLVPFASSAVS